MDWSRRLRMRHLHLLITLAETGSLSDTARLTNTTQPGMSKWLKELEEDAGAVLFARHARGLAPTAEGQVLIDHARRILSEMGRAQGNIEAMREGHTEIIAIGTSPASAPSLVPDAIMYFLELNPRAQVSLQEGTMNVLLEKLEQGKLDLVVGRVDSYAPRHSLHSEMLFREPLRVVARPDHPLVGRRNLTWEELYRFDWLLWPVGTPIRSRLDLALSTAGLKPLPCRIDSSSLMANLWLMQNSDLLSVASERVAAHFTGRGLLQALHFDVNADGAVGMCWRDEEHPKQALIDLLESLRKASKVPIRGRATDD